jgi:ABC-2 type transport system permease protein
VVEHRLPLSVRQYIVLIRAGLRAELQYRGNLVVTALGAMAFQGVSLAFVGIVVHRFGSIGGWGLSEVAFLYGMRMVSHGLMTVPLGQLWQSGTVLREGEFDRYLLRPINPYVQLITRRFALPSLGDIALGIIVLSSVSALAPVHWTPVAVLYLLAAVTGGALVEGSVLTAISALEFRFLSAFSLKSFCEDIITTFCAYPLSVLNRGVSYALTFIVPLAFIGYFPASILLGRRHELVVPAWLAAGAPLVGVLMFSASYLFFNRQMRHYASPGH